MDTPKKMQGFASPTKLSTTQSTDGNETTPSKGDTEKVQYEAPSLTKSQMELLSLVKQGNDLKVIAGPGTGKTFMIIKMLEQAYQSTSLKPQEILVTTFNKHNITQLLQEVHSGTDIARINWLKQVQFENIDKLPYRAPIQQHFKQQYNQQGPSNVSAAMGDFSGVLNNNPESLTYESSQQALSNPLSQEAQSQQGGYQTQSQTDLSIEQQTSRLIAEIDSNEGFYKQHWAYLKLVIFDEFQDCNQQQYQLLKSLKNRNRSLQVVVLGDAKQEIYSWRGSDQTIFTTKIIKDLPKMKQHFLPETFRSTPEIMNFCNQIITTAYPKEELSSTLPSGPIPKLILTISLMQDIVDLVQTLMKYYLPNQIGVITFTNKNAEEYSNEAYRQSIPQVWVGTAWKAKGLEFEAVIVVGVKQLDYPFNKVDLKSQYNCFYVACTRAKHKLYLVADFLPPSGFQQKLCRPFAQIDPKYYEVTRVLSLADLIANYDKK